MSESITVATIPHRPPFLFVDEIVELTSDRIVTTTLADPEAEFFRGHYPNEPVMTGVLICECCFQAGALLIAKRLGGFDPANGVPVLTRIQDARFKRIVRPGQTLRVEVSLDGYYQFSDVQPSGQYVLVVGPTPEEALAISEGTQPRVITVEQGQQLDMGDVNLLSQ